MVLCYDTTLVSSMFTGVSEHTPFIFSTGDRISSETSATNYQTTRFHNPEDYNIHFNCFKNITPQTKNMWLLRFS